MTWNPPESEAAWDEILSAYADGELNQDDTTALEAHLRNDPDRAAQFDSIRRTSALLQAWEVAAPSMQSPMSHRRDQASRENAWRGMLRLAAVFAVGVLTGALLMNARSPATTAPVASLSTAPPAYEASTVSPAMADAIFKEIEAAALSRRIEDDATQSRWKDAKAGAERLQSHYADTNAARDLADRSAGRRMLRHMLRRSN